MINRLTDIADVSDVNIAHFGYDELSRRTALDLANGTSTVYTYDLASRLTSLVTTISNPPSTINSYSYSYDPVGNRQTMTDSLGIHNYGYDDLYRLTSATLPSETYAYDPVGNRNPASFIYDAANRLLDDGVYTYSYDDNGNLTSKTSKTVPTDITNYTYNVEDQLIQATGLTLQATYAYDGLGRRIEKTVDAAITRYVYDNEDILAEYDGSNSLVAKYLHGPGVDEPLRMERGGQKYWYHVDGLGSITVLTNNSGSVVQTYVYDSFGNINSQTGTLSNPYTYTSREYDSESGLYYYRARYYDSRIGRFLSEDKWRGLLTIPGSLNLYVYSFNNSSNLIDPFGLWTMQFGFSGTAGFLGGGAIGGGAVVGYSQEKGWQFGTYETVGGGAYVGAGAGVTFDVIWSRNKAIRDLQGAGVSTGGSGRIPIGPTIGGDVNISKNGSKPSFSFHAGVGAGTPLEAHGFLNYTSVQEIGQKKNKK